MVDWISIRKRMIGIGRISMSLIALPVKLRSKP